MSKNISLEMAVKFASSLTLGKNCCCMQMSYNQHKLYKNNQEMMDCE